MRRILFLITLCMMCVCAGAQQMKLVKAEAKPMDARARTNARTKDGKTCALAIVRVVGVRDMKFADAVGDAPWQRNEYWVYLPVGTKTLRYSYAAGKKSGSVNLAQKGINNGEGELCEVTFDTEKHLRSAVFFINPADAVLTVDGSVVALDADGTATVDKPVGTYDYTVKASGYEAESGKVSLTSKSIITIQNVDLQPIYHTLALTGVPEGATVFVDNVRQPSDMLSSLQVTEGNHELRIVAERYDDYVQNFTVADADQTIPVSMSMKEKQTKVYKKERTRTSVNLRSAWQAGFTAGYTDLGSATGASAFDIGLRVNYLLHFAGYMALNVGGQFLYCVDHFYPSSIKDYYKDFQKNTDTYAFDFPVQFGASIPLDGYNRYLISFLGGAYARFNLVTSKSDSSNKDYAETMKENFKNGTLAKEGHLKYPDRDKAVEFGDYADYGLRASIQLDLSRFCITLDGSKSLRNPGFSVFGTVGFRLNK